MVSAVISHVDSVGLQHLTRIADVNVQDRPTHLRVHTEEWKTVWRYKLRSYGHVGFADGLVLIKTYLFG